MTFAHCTADSPGLLAKSLGLHHGRSGKPCVGPGAEVSTKSLNGPESNMSCHISDLSVCAARLQVVVSKMPLQILQCWVSLARHAGVSVKSARALATTRPWCKLSRPCGCGAAHRGVGLLTFVSTIWTQSPASLACCDMPLHPSCVLQPALHYWILLQASQTKKYISKLRGSDSPCFKNDTCQKENECKPAERHRKLRPDANDPTTGL